MQVLKWSVPSKQIKFMEAGSTVKYRRLKEIGKGAYGVIYLAEIVNFEPTDEESEDEKYVALKRLMTDVAFALS